MSTVTLKQAIAALGAEVRGPVPDDSIACPAISIDSRSIQPGEVFVAIKGQRFDGHQYIEEAFTKGASAVVVSREIQPPVAWSDRLLLRVSDTIASLQQLGHYVRRKWDRPLLAITGSMGKTTTKEFTATLLARRFRVFQSPGNFNNEIGVPLSLLSLNATHQLAILELGMNHAGEIANLSRICAPDAAMITNVAPVHLEFFPDLEAIAEAKAEVLGALGEGGHFLYNTDDPEVRKIARRCSFESTSFGLYQPADFRAAEARFTSTAEMKFELQTPEAAFQVSVPFSGKHFLYNIAAAAASAHVWGLSLPEIKEGLNLLRALPRRGQTIALEEITIWDESYNSNPSALECLLDTLLQIEGYERKILVLGDMLELGETSPRLHYQLGPSIARVNPGLLVTVGDYSRQMQVGAIESGLAESRCAHFEKAIAAASFLQDFVRAGDLVVVKGSRAIRMDQVVEVLQGVKT